MTRRVTLVLLVFVGLMLAAGQSRAADVAENVVRLRVDDSWGSGAYLGQRLVLTCAHLFEGDGRAADVWFPDGSRYSAQARAIDPHWDQALVELGEAPPSAGLSMALENPRIGDVVHAYGYGRGNRVSVTTGRVLGFRGAAAGDPTDWLEMMGRVDQGSSGGPIVNVRGEVIGNLWGTAAQQYQTVGLMCGRTRRFLLPWNARLEGQRLAQGQCCPGGACPPRGPNVSVAPRGPVPQLVPLPQPSAPSTSAPPPTSTPPAAESTIDYDRLAELLKSDPEFMAAVQGPPGERGEKGPPGERGEPGAPGAAGAAAESETIDTAALAAAITQALPGITVRTIDARGNVLDSEDIPLGGVLNIHHRPLANQ